MFLLVHLAVLVADRSRGLLHRGIDAVSYRHEAGVNIVLGCKESTVMRCWPRRSLVFPEEEQSSTRTWFLY